MSYYGRGDYYRGDYYRGDPGWPNLGGFLKKAAGVIGGGIGLLVGGPAGAAAGYKIGQGIGGVAGAATAVGTLASVGLAQSALQPGPGFNIGPVKINPMAIMPGGAPFISMGPQGQGGNPCGSGFHLDKTTRSRCVANRSMNVLNHKALRRGLRRAEGFEKIARRTVNALRRGPPKFKKRKAKR